MINVRKLEGIKRVIFIAICAFVLILTTVLMIIYGKKKNKDKDFTPPPFDDSAKLGEISENTIENYGLIKSDYGFKVGICASPKLEDGKLGIYFMNNQDNQVWLLVRILDADGKKEIGRTGIIKPGQFIESIDLKNKVKKGDKLTYTVYAYQKDTYLSEGSITLGNIEIKQY